MITRNKRSRKILKQSQKWKLIPKCYDLSSIKGLRQQKPYSFSIPNLWNQFTNKSIDELLGDQLLDIVVSSSNSFTGNTIIQETMTYQQFKSYNGPLTLYLAQIQLDIQCPAILNDTGKVFLWCSKGFTDSGWHYDSFENYLGVVQGIKIVYLRKKCYDWSQFEPIWSDQYNHMKKGNKMNSRFVILRQNEMLYIPQGMFHRVISYDDTIGINVWMESIQLTKIKGTHYHFRFVLNELIQKEMRQILVTQSKKNIEKINTKQYLMDIQTGFEKLDSFQSFHRSKQLKPLNQLIGIYICLLANVNSNYMVQFLLKLSLTINIDSLVELPETYQTIIALKLDEFAEKCENIQDREQFFEFMQKHTELLDSLKNSEIKLKQRVATMIVQSHLNL